MDKIKLKGLPSQQILQTKLQKTISTAWNANDKIPPRKIEKWLENFTGDALCSDYSSKDKAKEIERQIALFLLCNFVYYNENEIKHLMKTMFNNYAHSVFTAENKNIVNDNDFDNLLNITQFTYMGDISESSAHLLYLFRQENELSKYNFNKKLQTKNIVFVDDFSITGSQAYAYIEKYKSENAISNEQIFILLMIATDTAINELKKINDIILLPCIVMDTKSQTFSDSSIVFEGYEELYKNQAQKMCEYYGNQIANDSKTTPLGYKNGGYLFGAYYNIPDNTMPIFWVQSNSWNGLFKRYAKKYSINSNITWGGRYV